MVLLFISPTILLSQKVILKLCIYCTPHTAQTDRLIWLRKPHYKGVPTRIPYNAGIRTAHLLKVKANDAIGHLNLKPWKADSNQRIQAQRIPLLLFSSCCLHSQLLLSIIPFFTHFYFGFNLRLYLTMITRLRIGVWNQWLPLWKSHRWIYHPIHMLFKNNKGNCWRQVQKSLQKCKV